MFVYMPVHTSVCIRVRVYIYMCVYIYICICRQRRHSDKANEGKYQQYFSVYLDKCMWVFFILFLFMQLLLSVKGFPNEILKKSTKRDISFCRKKHFNRHQNNECLYFTTPMQTTIANEHEKIAHFRRDSSGTVCLAGTSDTRRQTQLGPISFLLLFVRQVFNHFNFALGCSRCPACLVSPHPPENIPCSLRLQAT